MKLRSRVFVIGAAAVALVGAYVAGRCRQFVYDAPAGPTRNTHYECARQLV